VKGTDMTATTATVNYEIVWGSDEADRMLYVDHGDGSWLSRDARIRADRKYFELCEFGMTVGYYINGVLTAGMEV
jgi:hypothetical protein